jgi:hypothetical protein
MHKTKQVMRALWILLMEKTKILSIYKNVYILCYLFMLFILFSISLSMIWTSHHQDRVVYIPSIQAAVRKQNNETLNVLNYNFVPVLLSNKNLVYISRA